MAGLGKSASLSHTDAEYYGMLRTNDRYVRILKPNFDLSFGSKNKHKPGILPGRPRPVKARYLLEDEELWALTRPSTAQETKKASPATSGAPWVLRRTSTTVLRPVAGMVSNPLDSETKVAQQASTDKARKKIQHEARDDALEFNMATNTSDGMDFEGFVDFAKRRAKGDLDGPNAIDETILRDLRHWFALLDRNGNGRIEVAEFFAVALFESMEAAGYEAGIYSLMQLYPEIFKQGKRVSRDDVMKLLVSHGFTEDPGEVANEVLKQAHGRDWKQTSTTEATTGEDLLVWFRDIVRPITAHSRDTKDKSSHDEYQPSIRDFIHFLAHGHRVHDRELKAGARARKKAALEQAAASANEQGSEGHLGSLLESAEGRRLGYFIATEQDHVGAEDIGRYIRNELSDSGRVQLLSKLQEWDLDGDRVLTLKEFYQVMSVELSVAGISTSSGAIQVIFDSMDKSGDGKVHFSELEKWFDAQMLRLRVALRRVRVFANLREDDIIKLQNAMWESGHKREEWVFRQGEEGSTFYVVLSGAADVLRVENGSSDEVCLAQLGAGDFFGERALLRNDVRYAGIRATGTSESEGLQTMSITRAAFETVLGPLHLLVPDDYAGVN